ILLKDYGTIYYWKKSGNESFAETLQKKPQMLPYRPEPQGEAICWAADGSGYFTISEKARNIEPVVYFYRRK
ncbi:MAG: hypothetical protein H7Y04_09995, partial [Verrucomicrobia bacterium]|nr:hypothetical protein [Cytophagales bacterium]